MVGTQQKPQAGFTIVEIVVVVAVFSIMILAMGSFVGIMQGTQRNAQYLDIATNAAKDEIEQLRNSNYSLLTAGTPINFTPSGLPQGSTGSAVISEDASLPKLKRVDVTVTYPVGTYTRTVKMSSLIGASGLAQ